jgi:hypothetical protein
MLTKKGHSVRYLLDTVSVAGGYMTIKNMMVSTGIKDFEGSTDYEGMASHINNRIAAEKKPSATYAKVLEQIDDTREYLSELYAKLFEVYQRDVDDTPKTRMSPKDKTMCEMLGSMPDKMLRDFAKITLGDKADDFILPSERDQLISAYIAVGKNGAVAVTDEDNS